MKHSKSALQDFCFDVLIIGSGAAGLSAALQLSPHFTVAVLSKVRLAGGSTYWAQGGISAVLSQQDSVDAHVADTLIAGAGLCDEAVVRFTAAQGREVIEWLSDLGMPFTRDGLESGMHLTREGGHSQRRVAHVEDSTGRALEEVLLEQARAQPNIQLFESHIAVDLITAYHEGSARCVGAYILNAESGHVQVFRARFALLATGGCSKVYLYTSNPDGSTGDGIAIAWRKGCRIANMEFVQFHPTCLYHPQAKSFLITEALRGEGAHLKLPDGERFMHRFDPRQELAPRDIVARAIDHEMKRLGADCLYLDISHKPAEFIRAHFPNIYSRCLEFGFDLTREPLPIVPAAHYTCGGVVTDLRARTDLPNLYAAGEVAYTGLHGANRLASNSLLECLVFGRAAAHDMLRRSAETTYLGPIPEWDESRVTDSDEHVVVTHNWDELRRFMWDYVGIVRTKKRLERAKHRVDLLNAEIHEFYSNFRITPDLIELRNLAEVADLIIQAATLRKESRGLHFTRDYPEPDPALEGVGSVLQRGLRPRVNAPCD
ncbi:MAG: L-aspartate oxidase [Thiotrichales bacterium]